MHSDALYSYSPRWLDESGLPAELNRNIGPGAWEVFRRLTELDVVENLFPDWFSVQLDSLAERSGLALDAVEEHMRQLSKQGYILLREGAGREGWAAV